ncbi:hypothetical protein [Neptunomonas antarctica]|uniref:SMODS and SLOG-associating 2TM effector domain-containing protein n=1 Tax=Neptunomonas antarctica TaxID=619304 RepID=A0A1N7IWT8_9GAMM|nr:hypothetical protein [Neptunomonas antarctica]SIS41539.1 hypothetical protein SAMN05421760_101245 [Neptunomonas antarctica]
MATDEARTRTIETYNARVSEWSLLQNQSDAYEKHALYIKLLSISITAGAILMGKADMAIACILAILWCQDAIWKTFQSRISDRIIKVEKTLKDISALQEHDRENMPPCQLNTDWVEQRSGFTGLILEYFLHAIRPTIAFPYVVLIGVLLLIKIQ